MGVKFSGRLVTGNGALSNFRRFDRSFEFTSPPKAMDITALVILFALEGSFLSELISILCNAELMISDSYFCLF